MYEFDCMPMGGIGAQIWLFCALLVELGHVVTIMLCRRLRGQVPDDLLWFARKAQHMGAVPCSAIAETFCATATTGRCR
jgi:hypothetical protein